MTSTNLKIIIEKRDLKNILLYDRFVVNEFLLRLRKKFDS
jgi:hypothetical protein